MRKKKYTERFRSESIAGLFLTAAILIQGCTGGDSRNRAIPSNERQALYEEYGELADIRIEMQFGDETEVLWFNDIKDWTDVERKNGKYKYTVHEESVKSYVKSLAERYNNVPESVEFTAHDGKKKNLNNNAGGWELDEEYAVKMITEYIKKSKTDMINMTDKSEKSNKWWVQHNGRYKYLQAQDKTYAEVSIEEQKLWVFQDGRLVMESPVVSGNPNTDHGTPTGAFIVFDKQKNAVLSGEDYETEVAYWIEFTEAIGFHDAVWQSEFGGDIYLVNGSHGCVNLSVESAKQLYKLAFLDMPVFIY